MAKRRPFDQKTFTKLVGNCNCGAGSAATLNSPATSQCTLKPLQNKRLLQLGILGLLRRFVTKKPLGGRFRFDRS